MQGYEIAAVSASSLRQTAPPAPGLARPPAAQPGETHPGPAFSQEATVVSLSPEARRASAEAARQGDQAGNQPQKTPAHEELSTEEQTEVAKLKSRDREVRAHEQAHRSAGGQYAGAARYEYQMGPDGKRYAVSGEVSIDVSAVPDNPEATVTKMETVKRAAMAPAQPSGADRAVYAQASRIETQARAEARKSQRAERQDAMQGSEEPSREASDPQEAIAASPPMAGGAPQASLEFAGFVSI